MKARKAPKVLFYPANVAYLAEYRNIILELERRGIGSAISWDFACSDEVEMKAMLPPSVQWIPSSYSRIGETNRKQPNGVLLLASKGKAVPQPFRFKNLVRLAREFLGTFRLYFRLRKAAREIITESDASVLILPAAGNLWRNTFVKTARRMGLKVAVVVIFGKIPKEGMLFHSVDTTGDPFWKKLSARISPSLFRHLDVRFSDLVLDSRKRVAAWLAYSLLGVLPEHPLSYGAEQGDICFVPSRYHEDLLRSLGEPLGHANIEVSGRSRYDSLVISAEERLARLRELGLEAGKPVIYCVIPHLAEHQLLTWEEQWADLLFFKEALTVAGTQLIFSFRPGPFDAQYRKKAEELGVRLSPVNEVSYVAPCCDLLVAAYNSTMHHFAIALGIPSVGIHFENYKWPKVSHYEDCKGVIEVLSKAQLRPTVEKILGSTEYRDELVARQIEVRDYKSPCDGQSSRRIVDWIQRSIDR